MPDVMRVIMKLTGGNANPQMIAVAWKEHQGLQGDV